MPGGSGKPKKDPHLLDRMDEILREIDAALDEEREAADTQGPTEE